jgi:flagellar basal body-associated protein FliL
MQPNPYSGYNPNPYPGEVAAKTKKSAPNKTIFVVIAVVMVLAIAAAYGVYLLNNRSTPTKTQSGASTQSNQPDASANVVPRSDGQLDLSTKVDAVTSVKEQTVKAKTKEQINLSSGFSFMATKIEPFTASDPNVKPANGKQFVVASVAVGNRAQSNTISISYLDFKLRDNQNNILSGHPSTQSILGNALANPTALKPGEQVAGKIVFEVNATDTDWVLIHKETYQKTTDNTTFIIEGDAVVSTKSDTATTTTPPVTPSATKQ